jgi:hypothetical protein
MRPLIRQTIVLLVGVTAVHAMFVLLTLAIYPPLNVLDTLDAQATLYRRSHRLAAFGIWEPALRQGRNLVILGGSNCKQGFRPAELHAELPEYRIHNLALDGTNVTEMRLVVDLAGAAMPDAVAKQAVFVVGICYPVFADNIHRNKWFGRPDDPNAGYDVGLRREIARWTPDASLSNYGEIPNSRAVNATFATALRPYFMFDNVKVMLQQVEPSKLQLSVGAVLNGQWQLLKSEPEPRYFLNPRADQLSALNSLIGTATGELNPEQFDELLQLAHDINRLGARLILVDMPLPEWHRVASAADTHYRRRLPEYLPQLADLEGFDYVDLYDAPLRFIDQGHPFPNQTATWGHALAEKIRPLLTGPDS